MATDGGERRASKWERTRQKNHEKKVCRALMPHLLRFLGFLQALATHSCTVLYKGVLETCVCLLCESWDAKIP